VNSPSKQETRDSAWPDTLIVLTLSFSPLEQWFRSEAKPDPTDA